MALSAAMSASVKPAPAAIASAAWCSCAAEGPSKTCGGDSGAGAGFSSARETPTERGRRLGLD